MARTTRSKLSKDILAYVEYFDVEENECNLRKKETFWASLLEGH